MIHTDQLFCIIIGFIMGHVSSVWHAFVQNRASQRQTDEIDDPDWWKRGRNEDE